MAYECVSDEALAHLKTYKYSGVDKSYISHYILRHYWNGFVELLPLWLAPNMVTLLGFFFILANVVLLEIYVPDLVGPAPSWVYYSFAFGLWMYSTLDNVDGKQARRTGTSSGLGELFDHGIDSLNCTLGSLLELAAVGYGATRTGAFTALIPCLPMFFSTWETYHTHTLYLGYFNGPTEGLILGCIFMLLSGAYGPQLWSAPLASLSPTLARFTGETLTFRDLWVPFLSASFFIAHLPACVQNVYRARSAKNLPTLPLLLEWTPMIVFTCASAAWLGSPHTGLIGDGKGGHLVLFCMTMSLVFGRMTTKIILAHLTRQPFPYFTVLLVPLVGGAVLANLPYVASFLPTSSAAIAKPFFGGGKEAELWYLRAYFVFAAIVYGRWAVLVIGRICEYLGIQCLTIPIEKQREAARAGKEGEKVGPGALKVEKEFANGTAEAKKIR
ncbi:hypothetical protein H2199_001281 [Coniosporium tulheliwenetii]|uniref:Uncharacterized protein n=1 Tax=Coniosporium tulheliwenetii TaxID=3383036 RepID=A0ACC2ZLK3_9PEZI|nr:hypothetical protein H2199_001281 [Cladosporium sp. JES 115]